MKINYLAVLVAAIAHFLVGGLWYGLIFGNKFIELIGWSPEKLREVESQNATKEMVLAFLLGTLLVLVMAHFMHYTKARTAFDGIQTALLLWLGFVATTQFATVMFEERNLGLYLLNIGYQLVGCLIAGVILALWRPREAKEATAQTA
jgi:Protein of unknown function (DUF1761)